MRPHGCHQSFACGGTYFLHGALIGGCMSMWIPWGANLAVLTIYLFFRRWVVLSVLISIVDLLINNGHFVKGMNVLLVNV